LKKLSYLLLLGLSLTACKQEKETREISEVKVVEEAPVHKEYGMVLNDYEVVRDTIRSGDYFGGILNSHGVSSAKVYEITQNVSETLNPTRLVVGKPYVILKVKILFPLRNFSSMKMIK
jgi:hypothetical protein